MTRPASPAALRAASPGPLSLAAHGHFWTGGEVVELADGARALRGQMYVEYFIPAEATHEMPIVLVHGGGGQGLDWLGTAAGGEGWAHMLVRRGHPVYVVDRPAHGRSPFHPDVVGAMGPPPPAGFIEDMFTRPEAAAKPYATAHLHTRWPDGGRLGNTGFERFYAALGPMPADLEAHHRDCQNAATALLDRIGPAILVTHSAGAPTGWLAADARPDLVAAIVAVEPVGPPFATRAAGTLTWGLTAAPMTFDPPVSSPEALATVARPAPFENALSCLIQADPARRLANLADIPVLVVTAQASWMALDNHGVVDFLAQAGVPVEHYRLEDHGILGNAHAMMLEENSAEIAALVERWIMAHNAPKRPVG